MRKTIALLFIVFLIVGMVPAVKAGEGGVWWVKSYGGSNTDGANDIAVTPNGDIIVAGYTYSFGAGDTDIWVLRLDSNGNVKWQKAYGSIGDDMASAVTITNNEDIIIAGYGGSFNGVWILRLDKEGNVKWQKVYSGDIIGGTRISALALTPDNDIIVVGYIHSSDTGLDAWVLRLDENGNIKWQKAYGGKDGDRANAVAVAENGDIIVAGWSNSFGNNAWVLRLDENGNIKWQKAYGGNNTDVANTVTIAPNGDIIVAGWTNSFGSKDIWVLRLDGNGNVKWQKIYGGRMNEEANAVAVAENGDIIVAGYTDSFGAGDYDALILRLDGNGDIKWQRTYGGKYPDSVNSIIIAPNGNIVAAGKTISFGAGDYDALIFYIPGNGDLPNCNFCYSPNLITKKIATKIWLTNIHSFNSHIKIFYPKVAQVADTSARVQDIYYIDILKTIEDILSDINSKINVYGFKNIESISILLYDVESKLNSGDYFGAYTLAKLALSRVEEIRQQYEKTKITLENAKLAISNYTSQGIILTEAQTLLNDAWTAFNNGNYTKAYDYASQALEKAKEIKQQHDKALKMLNQAETLLKAFKKYNQQDKEAESYLLKAQDAFQKGSYISAHHLAQIAYNTLKSDIEQKVKLIQNPLVPASIRQKALEELQKGNYAEAYTIAYPAYKEMLPKAAAIITSAVILLIILIMLYRRRKRKKERIASFNLHLDSANKATDEIEKAKLIVEALNIATKMKDPHYIQKAKSMINEELKRVLALIDEKLEKGNYYEASELLKAAQIYASSIGADISSKVKEVEAILSKKQSELDKMIDEANSLLSKADYSSLSGITKNILSLAEAMGIAGNHPKLSDLIDKLKTRIENLKENAEKVFREGNYRKALALYNNAVLLAEVLGISTNEMKERIKEIEKLYYLQLLDEGVKVEIPPEMGHRVGTEVPIFITNNFSQPLEITLDFSENRKLFKVSESLMEFPPVEPKRTLVDSIIVTPRLVGEHDFKVKVTSNFGNIEKTYKVRVLETAKALGPTPRVSTIPTPEALEDIYEEFYYIGEGGFAKVFKAKRKHDGKIVALKIPKTLDPAVGRAFIREISNWFHLKHLNIVELYDANVLPIPYLEMEYCESSLAKIQKPLSIEEAALIIFNVAEGLKYAHGKKIIHRDLKPSNILLKQGIPKISDWGLSKVLEESLSASTTMSFTPYYAAPEQIDKKFGHTDERTDIWQLGVIFYELVTGRLPFEGSLSEVMHGILNKNPVPPSHINPEAKRVESIIMKMLDKDKSKRYKSIEELQRDLAKVLNLTYSESLKKSKTMGDLRRTLFYLTELLLINLKINNPTEAYKYASDLVYYVRGGLKEDVRQLAGQVKFRLEEGLDIPPELIEKAEIIIHKIRLGYKEV